MSQYSGPLVSDVAHLRGILDSAPDTGPANRSLWHVEPVSHEPKRKLETNEQRPGLEKRPSCTRCPRICAQRRLHVSLSRRNVGGTHTPGNDTAETGLAG